MLDYAALAAVAAVVREGSFERAAASLNVTPSAVSQRVRGLEERLGTVLIVRGQPCQPTEACRALMTHHDRVALLEAELAPLFGAPALGAAAARLRIAVNADSLASWFPAAMAAFAAKSDAALEVVLDDEGHTADRLRRGDVMAAVTAEPGPVQGCKSYRLGAIRYAAAAGRGFHARWFAGRPIEAALKAAPQLRFDRRDHLQIRWAEAVHGVRPGGPVTFVPSTEAFLNLALRDVGWGMQPLMLAGPALADGSLVDLAPGRTLDVALHWIVARLPVRALTDLTAAVREAATSHLAPVS